ncbi:MAG: penicillin-binding transpeptidase domain-containing protein, partial [bacterium]|nr:penicillin-binding transpeptidase domain-containing protein [bacterium]
MNFLGVSFADFIDKKSASRLFPKKMDLESVDLTGYDSGIGELPPPSVWKNLGLKTLFFICIAVLISRIATMQLIKGTYYQGLSDDNRIVRRPLHSVRGVITDRNNKVLVRNEPYFTIEGSNTLLSQTEYRKYESTASARQKEKINIKAVRNYLNGPTYSHIFGYISPITSEEMVKIKQLTAQTKIKYNGYDLVGRSGLEEQYEAQLKGIDGNELVEISSSGKVLKILGVIPQVPGNTVQTSLDASLQQFSYDAVSTMAQKTNAKSGVAIVQDTKTGAILTLVSYPSFDNNSFTNPQQSNEVQSLFTNQNIPLLNRAVSGVFAPGSTYKIITALAGLESKIVTKDSTYTDTGSVTLSGITFNNWYFRQYGKVEGEVALAQALARSNDTYFYRLAIEMGPEKLIEQSHKFRLGEKVGIDIPGEVVGLIPSPQWKKKVIKEDWYPGNTINMSIGQGDVLTTPLQISNMTNTIANDGKVMVPTIASHIRNGDNKIICKRNYETDTWEGNA